MSKDRWDGNISSMRVSPTAFPELYDELKKTSHRDRIRRFCSLATMGLLASKFLLEDKPIQQKTEHMEVKPKEERKKTLSKEDRFINKLI